MRRVTAIATLSLLLAPTALGIQGGSLRAADMSTTTTLPPPPETPGEPSEPPPSTPGTALPPPPVMPGTPSEPAPQGGRPPTTAPTQTPGGAATGEAPDVSEIYGVCAERGPVISGELLSRTRLAIEPGTRVAELQLIAEGASIREIEIPYYNWSWDRAGKVVTARTNKPQELEHFWLWVAFSDVERSRKDVTLEVKVTFADGTSVAHSENGELPLLTIPFTSEQLNNLPEGSEAGVTPIGQGEPCRIGEAPAAETEGKDGLPWLPVGTGIGGAAIGFLAAFLLRRRS